MRIYASIHQALLCTLLTALHTGCCRKNHQCLQKYEKTENHELVCTECPQIPLVRNSRSPEHCARKCKKAKKNCRAFNFQRNSLKCHLLPFDRFGSGVQTQNNCNFTLFEKKGKEGKVFWFPELKLWFIGINKATKLTLMALNGRSDEYYIRECVIGTDNYRGRRSWTKSNITCQAWSDNIINEHTFDPDKYPTHDLRQNFCRNPNNDPGGPWCYTIDPNVRAEECGLPQCSEEECMKCNGEDYRGKVDHTENGRECQRWDSVRPHKHIYQPKKYRDKDLKDNYCRNPDNRLRPWCYTMDPKVSWEYCNITVCDSNHSKESTANMSTSCVEGNGDNYRGTTNVTPDGVFCQRWDAQFPHRHSYLPENYKCKDLRENYCRNPDGSDHPWCFTTNPNQRKANCTQIPQCGAEASPETECYEDTGETYQGTLSITRSGIPCANWSQHINSGDSHSTISHVWLEKNHCRNPDRDKHGPWCYTNPNTRLSWDYCKLKQCESATAVPQVSDGAREKVSCFVHINTRIVGGHKVRGSDGSWVVSIQRENVHLCGGSLIREDWILTDQQCFTSCVPDLKDYSVQVGLRKLNESFNHPRLRISQLICGPEKSNLVMLKLSNPAPVSEGASTIHLPVKECHIPEGTNCTMYGWGETKGTGSDDTLNSVTMPMDAKMCSQIKGDAGDSRICAGGRRGEGVCDRDYGGPLVCQEHERKVIIGVSIQRTKCASSQPALFVNVAFYSEWIYKVFKLYPGVERK